MDPDANFMEQLDLAVSIKRQVDGLDADAYERLDAAEQSIVDDADRLAELVTDLPQAKWEDQDPPFTKYTALRVKHDKDDEGVDLFDFYINVDNFFLKHELKATKIDEAVVRAQFTHGMVLLGLGLLYDDSKKGDGQEGLPDGEAGASVFANIERLSSAVAPMLVPMINSLGGLDLADVADASGEAT